MLPANQHSSVISFPFASDRKSTSFDVKTYTIDTSFPITHVSSHNSISEVRMSSVSDVPASAPARDPCKYAKERGLHTSYGSETVEEETRTTHTHPSRLLR